MSPNGLPVPRPCQNKSFQHMGFSFPEGVLSLPVERSLPHVQHVHEVY